MKVLTIDSLLLKLGLYKGNNNEVLRKWLKKVGVGDIKGFSVSEATRRVFRVVK